VRLRIFLFDGSLEVRKESLVWASVDTVKRRFCGCCGYQFPAKSSLEDKNFDVAIELNW
jgi:hypothetical protein